MMNSHRRLLDVQVVDLDIRLRDVPVAACLLLRDQVVRNVVDFLSVRLDRVLELLSVVLVVSPFRVHVQGHFVPLVAVPVSGVAALPSYTL